jgi:hypothetical protein
MGTSARAHKLPAEDEEVGNGLRERTDVRFFAELEVLDEPTLTRDNTEDVAWDMDKEELVEEGVLDDDYEFNDVLEGNDIDVD